MLPSIDLKWQPHPWQTHLSLFKSLHIFRFIDRRQRRCAGVCEDLCVYAHVSMSTHKKVSSFFVGRYVHSAPAVIQEHSQILLLVSSAAVYETRHLGYLFSNTSEMDLMCQNLLTITLCVRVAGLVRWYSLRVSAVVWQVFRGRGWLWGQREGEGDELLQ